MRSTQLQTLRLIAAGNDTVPVLVLQLGRTWQQVRDRVARLAEGGYLEPRIDEQFILRYSLTDRARALLETRAQLDGETEPGLGYMQGKGAS